MSNGSSNPRRRFNLNLNASKRSSMALPTTSAVRLHPINERPFHLAWEHSYPYRRTETNTAIGIQTRHRIRAEQRNATEYEVWLIASRLRRLTCAAVDSRFHGLRVKPKITARAARRPP